MVLVLGPGQAVHPAGALDREPSSTEELAEDVVLEEEMRVWERDVAVVMRRARSAMEVRADPGEAARTEDVVQGGQGGVWMGDVLEHRERHDPVEVVRRERVLDGEIGEHEMRPIAGQRLPGAPLDDVDAGGVGPEPVVEIPDLEARPTAELEDAFAAQVDRVVDGLEPTPGPFGPRRVVLAGRIRDERPASRIRR